MRTLGLVPIDYVSHLRADADRMARAVETGPLDAPVAACPGWDLRALVAHTGWVHRWANAAASSGQRPEQTDFPAPGDADLADWLRDGASDVAAALAAIDPDAPTWHVFPVARVGRVWPRRQAHETALHRWDAEHAIGAAGPIDPQLASDGIDEYFEVMLPRLVARDGATLPEANIHLHCTDTAGEWTAHTENGELRFTREHAKGAAAIRGRAEDLLLAMWGRPTPDGALDIVGDRAVADAWLALGGL